MTHRGSCRCGRVTVELRGDAKWVANCHCRDCRKATGSAFATYVGCENELVELRGEISRYLPTQGITRSVCANCGSPIAYEGERWPGEIHLCVGVFDQPEAFVPKAHVYTAFALPWVFDLAELPRFSHLPGQDS